MTSTPSPYETYVKNYSKLSDSVKQLITKWKTILVSRCEGWGTRCWNTSEPMIKSPRAILQTPNSLTSKSPSVWGFTYPSNGSNNSTTATSPAIQLMMACKTLHTSYPSTHPHYPQMICQLDLFHSGSMESSPGHTPSSCTWLNVHAKWTTRALLLTSSITTNMMKNIRKSMQKSIGSSWMPPPLSKIMPCVSSSSKHQGALKVSLTLKGWVLSPPVPSGAHVSQMTKMKKTTLDSIAEDINSEEEVMKQPSRLSQEGD
jgi:hypothetical protein